MTGTKTADELKQQILELGCKINDLQVKRRTLLDAWALAASPHEIGTITPCMGFSHMHKPVIVGRVAWTEPDDPRVRIFGRLLKKDGTPSLIEVDWCID